MFLGHLSASTLRVTGLRELLSKCPLNNRMRGVFPERPLLRNSLEQWSPTISAPGTGFGEEDFFRLGEGMVPG